jgi:uncharacterized protein (DUF4415 family)
MKKEYDFSRGKRGPAISTQGKTCITIYLDNATFNRFKAESERTGKGYQTLINEALAKSAGTFARPATAAEVRDIVRAELAHHIHT